MRKVSLILAVVLLAVPAWAASSTVTVTAVCDSPNKQATIQYSSNLNKPRAFALTISVDGGAKITAISGYKVGESTSGSKGYGIFPGTIDINDSGVVLDYGTPVAPSTAPDNPGQLGSSSIVIEMGSLYDVNIPADAPGLSGTLCTITTDKTCTVSLTEEKTYRGGVVMENPDEVPVVSLVGCSMGLPPCYPECKADYGTWLAVGKPPCWCIKRQCHGDTNNAFEGSSKTGYNYVHFNDLSVLVGAWSVLEPAAAPTPSGPGVKWDDSKPADVNICADFNHGAPEGSSKTGYNRVHFLDLAILVSSWNILEPATAPTPSGPGVTPDCLNCP